MNYSDLKEESGGKVPSHSKHKPFDGNDAETEHGDIGVSGELCASYQKTGYRTSREENQTNASDDIHDEEGVININSSLRRRRSYAWFRHPKVRENWKTVAGAIFLLIIGILFLISGIVLSAIPKHDGPKAMIFFVCAAVCILPGAYHTVYIYRATKGWRGYTFESLPSFR